MKKSQAGWILLCILSIVTTAFGQLATTSLRGTIKDPSGALVPGAKITITDKANGKSLSVVADSSGSYSFAQISIQVHHRCNCIGFRHPDQDR